FKTLERNIQFRDLSFQYANSDKGLQKINLNIPQGSMLAIVGATGSGKSTLIRLLARFYEHQEGQLLIDGVPISEYDLESFRSKLAVVTQDAFIFSDTFKANICYGLENISEVALSEAVEKACLSDLVASLPKGLDSKIGKDGIELSGGEAQRLSIARAIL
ncbi:UNVERIFIED_CONTAM: hypothetical protein GTU68_032791, partial [Idotea baltica]|nr:hypothetical protein [Idotea baltica]